MRMFSIDIRIRIILILQSYATVEAEGRLRILIFQRNPVSLRNSRSS